MSSYSRWLLPTLRTFHSSQQVLGKKLCLLIVSYKVPTGNSVFNIGPIKGLPARATGWERGSTGATLHAEAPRDQQWREAEEAKGKRHADPRDKIPQMLPTGSWDGGECDHIGMGKEWTNYFSPPITREHRLDTSWPNTAGGQGQG